MTPRLRAHSVACRNSSSRETGHPAIRYRPCALRSMRPRAASLDNHAWSMPAAATSCATRKPPFAAARLVMVATQSGPTAEPTDTRLGDIMTKIYSSHIVSSDNRTGDERLHVRDI